MSPLPVAPVETAAMRTRDGVRLDADIYRPVGAGPFPILLLRQAYGRRVAATVSYAHPRWYASHGYVVVVQDVRGRGSSEGRFETLEHEATDGADTIEWCAGLPGTTGTVGMYGFSYQGMNQLLAATLAGPALKALAPAMIGWEVRHDMVSEGGALLLAGTLGWAAQLGADTARHRGDREAYTALREAARVLPINGPVTALPEVMTRWADYHHYFPWTAAEPDDPLWHRISPAKHVDAILSRALPMLFVGGWYDFTLVGTLAAWRAVAPAQPDRTRLVVGPWAHLPWGRVVGETDFGEQAVSDIDRLQIAWFDRWLKGGNDDGAPVRLFDLGLRRWREETTWAHAPRRMLLGGDGRASVHPDAGWLAAAEGDDGEDSIVHDPWRPAPTCGGRWGSPPGPVDRRAIDQRGDVMTFTSAPLTAPLTISGAISADLYAEADAPSFDLVCTVSRVTADGRVFGFAEGIRRVASGDGPGAVSVDLHAACITMVPGERIRLSVAGASFPAYGVNPGQGDPIATPQIDACAITVTVRHGRTHPSALLLAVAEP